MLALRKAAGLTQVEFASLVGEKQEAISFWERSDKPPRSDALPKLAKALGVTVEEILGEQPVTPARRPLAASPGPTSEIQRIFEQVRNLPRRQQRKVFEIVTAFIDMYSRKAG